MKIICPFTCGHTNAADGPADPDDRWSNQYREREKNSIYRWIGVRHGGELLTVYERDGEEGVLRFAQEKMESMLYNEGAQPQLIKFSDYTRWHKSVNIALGIMDDATKVLNEADSRFSAHDTQWRMNKRGMDGETLVHLLLNRKELVCHEIARMLINRYPGMAKDIYLGDELFGQSCLHLAIVHDDYETAKILLEYGASVNARANGDFFMPEGFEPGGNNIRCMEYEGYAYYGEYPLAFAACFENKDIYDLLIQYGANPDKQDTFGNTTSMYSYSARHWHRPAHSVENFAGQTPLTLATKLGRQQIFEEMLELMKVEFWRFSDMTCSAYPLDALDTIRPDGSTNRFVLITNKKFSDYDSALMTVLAGGTTEHLKMVNSEVIQRLLADKWDAFGRRKMFERLALLVVHLVALGIAVYLRPAYADHLYLQSTADVLDWVRTGAELIAILCSCWFVFIQQIDELRWQGMRAYLRNLSTVPGKVVYIASNLCLLFCVPLRIAKYITIEDALLSFAFPGSWAYMLFFARTTKLIGPFVQMIYAMIAGDLFRFVLISTIFMMPFTETMYFLGKDISTKQRLNETDADHCFLNYSSSNYDSFFTTFLTLFRICMNAIFYEELACANYELLMKTLFLLFTFLMFIMMITLLIAMINNTYSELIEEAELTWRQQHGQVVLVLERGINAAQLAACQLDYSVRMNLPGREARGLMVIKQTTKTRAHQRKQALANWKLVGRKVITMAKELGTQSAKYLLHSHDRLVADDTVVGGGGGTSTVPRTSYSMRPLAPARNAVSNRAMSNIGDGTIWQQEDEAESAVVKQQQNQQQQAAIDKAAAEDDEQRPTSSSSPSRQNMRRPSVPHLQYSRQSIPSLDRHQQNLMLFADASKLRDVVTHAAVNNMKLKRAEHEETQRLQKKQILIAGVGHSRKVPGGVNNLPGMVNVARRQHHLLLTAAASKKSSENRPSTAAGGPVRMSYLNVPQEKLKLKHQQLNDSLTLVSVASNKTLVRGVELLPSVMPNIPASPTRSYDRRHSGEWDRRQLQQQRVVGGGGRGLPKSHNVVAMESAVAEQHQDYQHDNGIILTMTMPTSTAIQIRPQEDQGRLDNQQNYHVDHSPNEQLPMATGTSSNTAVIHIEPPDQGPQRLAVNKARRRIRPDLFKAKNSPPTNSIRNNNHI